MRPPVASVRFEIPPDVIPEPTSLSMWTKLMWRWRGREWKERQIKAPEFIRFLNAVKPKLDAANTALGSPAGAAVVLDYHGRGATVTVTPKQTPGYTLEVAR